MTGQNARVTALAAGAVTIIGLLSGCATPPGSGSSATITYEVDGQWNTTAFTPSNVTCNDGGAVSLSLPDKPFNGVSLSRGSTDTVEA
jgi:plastocyanin